MISDKKIKIGTVVLLVVVIGAGYFLGQRYWWGVKYVPEEFIQAREGASFVAEKIVFLAHKSLAGLEQIGGLDEQKKYSVALNFTKEELERNYETRQEAIFLSSQLATMAAFLYEIEPNRAQALATEAVGHEVNLVNHLLIFHGLLSQLFELLNDKFTGRVVDSDGKVERLIASINNEIKTINSLNLKFNTAMKRFDRIY